MRLEICVDCADPRALAEFWAAVVGASSVRGNGGPYCTLAGAPAGLPELVFQRVPEPKQGKNRLHLDLYVPDPVAEVARVESLGATRLGEPVAGGDECAWWQIMADPEGNEFCVCAGPANSV
jgi:predicted enzyme related to lactoylglutathione lyase